MPKGGASSLTPVYAGLQDDLNIFLKAFLQKKTRRFSDYKQLFLHRGMVQLFNGRNNSAEIIEFNEYLLMYCLPYLEEFVCPGTPRSIEERLFGLYSLYTFFYLQEVNHVVKIRMDPDADLNFRKFSALLMEEREYDAYMITLKLYKDKAFKLAAFIPIYDPSCFKRFYTDNDSVTGVSVQTNVNDPLSKIRGIADGTMMMEISVAYNEYNRLKKAMGMKALPGLDYPDPQVSVRMVLEKAMKELEIQSGVVQRITADHTTEQLGSHGMVRSEIKEKAYSAQLKLARFRRHRTVTPLKILPESFDYSNSAGEIDESGPITRGMAKRGQVGRRKRVVEKKRHGRKAKAPEVTPEEQDAPEDAPESCEPATKKAKSIDQFFCVDSDDDDLPLPSGVTLQNPESVQESKEDVKEILEQIQNLTSDFTEIVKKEDPDFEYQEINDQESIEIDKKILEFEEVVKKEEANNDAEYYGQETQEISLTVQTDPPKQKPKKSCIKTPVKKTVQRRVSFAENNCGEINTTVHHIPPRPTPISSGSFSDADDEREEVDITMYIPEPLVECENPPGKTMKKKTVEYAEIPERTTDLEQNGDGEKYTRVESQEPEEPASDVVMYYDSEDIFQPLDVDKEIVEDEQIDSDEEGELFIEEMF